MKQLPFPKTQQQAQRPEVYLQRDFSGASCVDFPGPDISRRSVVEFINMVVFGIIPAGRRGSLRYNTAAIPTSKTLTAAVYKDGTSVYGIPTVTDDECIAGDFLVWSDGTNDRLIAHPSGYWTSRTDEDRDPDYGCTIRKQCWGRGWHAFHQKVFIQFGTKLYYTDADLSGYTEIPVIGKNSLAQSASRFQVVDKDCLIFNANGIFRIAYTDGYWYCHRVNSTLHSHTLADQNQQDADNPHGRQYVLTLSRILGDYRGTRFTSGNTILHETGTADSGQSPDFCKVWNAWRPGVGDDAAYSVLYNDGTGSVETEQSVWNAIDDGCFIAEMNGLGEHEINGLNFSDCENNSDNARVIENGLRDYFPTATCVWKAAGDSGTFYITSGEIEDGSIEPLQDGTLGTNIASLMLLRTGDTGMTLEDQEMWFKDGYEVASLSYPSLDSHLTHYSIYGSGDLGLADTIADDLIWVKDIPVMKAFRVNVNTSNLEMLGDEEWDRDDEFNTVRLADTTQITATYIMGSVDRTHDTSSSKIIAVCTLGSQDIAACIGARKCAKATRTGSIVTIDSESDHYTFTAADVGRLLFWEDGSISHITRYINSLSVEVAESGTMTNQAICWDPTSRTYMDTVENETLVNYRSGKADFALQTRYWTPLPANVIGCAAPGFVSSVDSDDNTIHYTAYVTNMSRFIGHHNAGLNIEDGIKDTINYMRQYGDRIVAICDNSTYATLTSAASYITADRISESVTKLPRYSLIATEGCVNTGSIQDINSNQTIMVTSAPAVKMFDGAQYSATNYAKDSYMKNIETLAPNSLSAYDEFGGYFLYGTKSQPGSVDNYLNYGNGVCYHFGFKTEQGVGWSEFDGEDMVWPEPNINGLRILDDNGNPRTVMLDETTGRWYDIAPRNGPENSGLIEVFRDKATSASDGTDIECSVYMRELTGESERMELEHLETRAYLRPWATGGDYLAGFTMSAQLIVDGVTTEPPVCDELPVGGTLIFDRKKKGKLIQIRLSTTTSKFWMSSVEIIYLSRDRGSGASSTRGRTSTQTYQREYSDSQLLWLTRGPQPLLNRSVGVVATGDYDDEATGMDGVANTAIKGDGGDGLEVEMLDGIEDDFQIQFGIKLDGTP